ncbi:MAG TPA: hypothetical protein VK589_20080 [Chryseolinea sp.]|nr:hypothetical protein [Chryseolinea sp.]
MKTTLLLTFALAVVTAHAQKTTRETVAQVRGVDITKAVTEGPDGTQNVRFYMMGQNAQYTHITDIISIKYGTAEQIGELLVECMKFLPEKKGTTLQFKGNTIGATGGNYIVIWGEGHDDRGNVVLNKSQITKLLQGLRKHL